MELPMAIVIAVLFTGGTYLILRPNLIRVVMGLGLYSNAVNLLMITSGGFQLGRTAPFVKEHAATAGLSGLPMDPLPPDIILTAIVISFAVGALFLTLCYRVYMDYQIDNPELLPNDSGDPDDAAGDAPYDDVPNVIHELSQPRPDAPAEKQFNAGPSRAPASH